MVVYMKITKDKYELPVAIADSAVELGKLTGHSANTIHSSITHCRQWGIQSSFVRVEIDDKESD